MIRENCLRNIGISCIAMVVDSLHHTSSCRVSPTNWEFHVLLFEEVSHKKWCPIQVLLAWSVCMVVCTETQTPGSLDHINNQTFLVVSTGGAIEWLLEKWDWFRIFLQCITTIHVLHFVVISRVNFLSKFCTKLLRRANLSSFVHVWVANYLEFTTH